MKRTRSPWPFGIAAGLGIVVAVNVVMVHLALSHPSAPAAKDHYRESTQWNEVQAERGRSQALGWHVSLRPCDRLDARGCPLTLDVTDAHGAPVPGLRGQVTAQRADDVRLDREATLTASAAPGRYVGQLELAQPGLYTVSIRLEGGPAPWVDQRRVRVVGSP